MQRLSSSLVTLVIALILVGSFTASLSAQEVPAPYRDVLREPEPYRVEVSARLQEETARALRDT